MSHQTIRSAEGSRVAASIAGFARDVRAAYGARIENIYLFGSRARGDHDLESDADVAIVLRDAFDYWQEKTRLGDIAFDRLLSDDLLIQLWPFTSSEWSAHRPQSSLLRAARRDAIPLDPAA